MIVERDDVRLLIAVAVLSSADRIEKIAVEDIQDSVERVLIKSGYSDVAKSYILYRKLHEKQRSMKSTVRNRKIRMGRKRRRTV